MAETYTDLRRASIGADADKLQKLFYPWRVIIDAGRGAGDQDGFSVEGSGRASPVTGDTLAKLSVSSAAPIRSANMSG